MGTLLNSTCSIYKFKLCIQDTRLRYAPGPDSSQTIRSLYIVHSCTELVFEDKRIWKIFCRKSLLFNYWLDTCTEHIKFVFVYLANTNTALCMNGKQSKAKQVVRRNVWSFLESSDDPFSNIYYFKNLHIYKRPLHGHDASVFIWFFEHELLNVP